MKDRIDYFFEEGYKVIINYNTNVWNQVTMAEWCKKHLEGECICGVCLTMDNMISWYFENKEDAMIFALRWKDI